MSPSNSPVTGPEHAVLRWIERVVIGLDLCPFAGKSMSAGAIRTVIADGDVEAVLTRIATELERLIAEDARIGATTVVLVCDCAGQPTIAADFDDYLDLFAMAEGLAESLGFSGRIQLASFHPDYLFAEAQLDDPANLSNRSPVPLVHLLLEEAVTAAVTHHPDAEGIPERNMARLREIGQEGVQQQLSRSPAE